jgi:hypothetical protein
VFSATSQQQNQQSQPITKANQCVTKVGQCRKANATKANRPQSNSAGIIATQPLWSKWRSGNWYNWRKWTAINSGSNRIRNIRLLKWLRTT